MSLEIEQRHQKDLAIIIKSGDIDSKLRGIGILSDSSLAENKKTTLVLSVVRDLADEAIEGKKLASKADRTKVKRGIVKALKELLAIDVQSRKNDRRDIASTRNYKGRDEIKIDLAPNVTMVYSYLSGAEDETDQERFDVLKGIITAEMGEKYLIMVDADWVTAKKAKSYINACIGKIIYSGWDSMDAYLRLDDLLAKFSTRGDLTLYDEEEVSNVAFMEAEETFCETVFASLNSKAKARIIKMADDEFPGAVEFLMAAEQSGELEKKEKVGSYDWEEISDEE